MRGAPPVIVNVEGRSTLSDLPWRFGAERFFLAIIFADDQMSSPPCLVIDGFNHEIEI